jgi:glutathione synthase/RimK-type ligase-like ATP-grasp enzyme
MKNLFWIDSFTGYDEALIQESYKIYYDNYAEHVLRFDHKFIILPLDQIHISYNSVMQVVHPEYGNLLDKDCAVFVGVVHPDPAVEKRLETLYRLFSFSKRVKMINKSPIYPMICKDKMLGYQLASEHQLNILPTYLYCPTEFKGKNCKEIKTLLGDYPWFCRPSDLIASLGTLIIKSESDFDHFTKNIPIKGKSYIIQPFITIKQEFRIYLWDSKSIACRVKDNTKLNKFSKPQRSSVPVPSFIINDSETFAQYVGLPYLCLDWLYDGENYWFSELETAGGFKEIDLETQKVIADAFFSRLT